MNFIIFFLEPWLWRVRRTKPCVCWKPGLFRAIYNWQFPNMTLFQKVYNLVYDFDVSRREEIGNVLQFATVVRKLHSLQGGGLANAFGERFPLVLLNRISVHNPTWSAGGECQYEQCHSAVECTDLMTFVDYLATKRSILMLFRLLLVPKAFQLAFFLLVLAKILLRKFLLPSRMIASFSSIQGLLEV